MSSLFAEAVVPQAKGLRNLLTWFDQLQANAEARGFDAEVIVESRLAPDMFPFRRQVQAVCDAAKFTAARLGGREAPSHPDTETTLAELRARVEATVAYLDTFAEADLEGAANLILSPKFLQGQSIRGEDYLRDFATPNYRFHLTISYAILRSNGVPLGKRTYLGSLNLRP